MAIVSYSYFDMNVVKIQSKTKEWMLGTNEFVDKLTKELRAADPEARKISEEQVRQRVVEAMFANPYALIKVAQLAFDDPTIYRWETTSEDRKEEVDLGPLVGKKVMRNDPGSKVRIGTIIEEHQKYDEDENRDDTVTIEYPDGQRETVDGRAYWKLQIDSEWLLPHDVADELKKAKSSGSVRVKKYRKRK